MTVDRIFQLEAQIKALEKQVAEDKLKLHLALSRVRYWKKEASTYKRLYDQIRHLLYVSLEEDES